jgi:hypothetical protein
VRKVLFAVSISAALVLSACANPVQSNDSGFELDDDAKQENQAQEPPPAQEEKEEVEPPSGFLKDEISLEQIADQLDCEVLSPALRTQVGLDVLQSRTADMSSVEDPYDAKDFLEENSSWVEAPKTNEEYLESIDQILGTELEQLVEQNLKFSSTELKELFPDIFAAYENQIPSLAADACGLTDEFTEGNQATKKYDADRARIIRQAGNIPWYPKGYKELTSSVAYQSLDPSQMNCGYNSRHDCYQAKFIAETQCNLFVELSFLKDGLRVDDGIDSAYVGPSSPALLTFASFDSPRYGGTGTVRIEDVTCY